MVTYVTCCLSSVILWAIKMLFICKAHIKMFSPGSPMYVGNFVESLARLPELWLLVRAVAKFPMALTAFSVPHEPARAEPKEARAEPNVGLSLAQFIRARLGLARASSSQLIKSLFARS